MGKKRHVFKYREPLTPGEMVYSFLNRERVDGWIGSSWHSLLVR